MSEETHESFEYFTKWKESLDSDIGDHPDDWLDWYKCFKAGWKACYENLREYAMTKGGEKVE